MQIDGFTLVAQIFNFALLVVLLRLVLYRPIMDAIRRREEEVEGRLEAARASRAEAEDEAERYRQETERLEEERTQALAEVAEEAAALRERLKAEVRDDVDLLRREWREAVRRERETFLAELRTLVTREAFSIAKETLRSLANASLEEQVVSVFVHSLSDLNDDDREQFENVVAGMEGPVRVRSALPMAEEQRDVVRSALERWLGSGVEVVFEIEGDLALGIEAVAEDRKIGWSVASHLDSLEAEARALMERATR